MDTVKLEARFQRCAAALGAERETDQVFQQLQAAYAEPHRIYHRISHIEHGLGLLDELVGERPAVEMALWFHDAVLRLRPLAQNEERSAEMAYASSLRMGLPEARAREIATMIRATATLTPRSEDEGILVDLDLAILGSEPLTYATFERDIRAEYRWVALEGVYRRARARVLSGILSRPSIFSHEAMRSRFEEQARANMTEAVAELLAVDDAPRVHATDDHVFLTRGARLEEQHAWSDVYIVSYAAPFASRSAELSLSFGPLDDRYLRLDVDDPRAQRVIARLRAIPGYRHDAEAAATPFAPALVYSRGRAGVIQAPVRLPATDDVAGRGPYRS